MQPDIGIKNPEFVPKTQFLWYSNIQTKLDASSLFKRRKLCWCVKITGSTFKNVASKKIELLRIVNKIQ